MKLFFVTLLSLPLIAFAQEESPWQFRENPEPILPEKPVYYPPEIDPGVDPQPGGDFPYEQDPPAVNPADPGGPYPPFPYPPPPMPEFQ